LLLERLAGGHGLQYPLLAFDAEVDVQRLRFGGEAHQ
jgi:hypothetical protein